MKAPVLISPKKFENAVRKLTRNERVIKALAIGFASGNYTVRPELGLYPTDHNEFKTLVDWIRNAGWVKA